MARDDVVNPVQPLDNCTCVCPHEDYEEPSSFTNSNIKASIPSPIVMELYANATAEGSPLGPSFGNVTISFTDNVASVVFNVADPVWYVITETDFYIGEDRLPTNAS